MKPSSTKKTEPSPKRTCPACKGTKVGARTKLPCQRCKGSGEVGGYDPSQHPWRRGQAGSIAAYRAWKEKKQ